MAEITLAKKAGFCFGVDRAIKLINELVDEGRKVATLGPIIHNGQVIEELESRGVKVVNSPSEVEDGAVLVLRTHGVTRDVLHSVEECGCEYIDAACPFVKKIHKIVLDNSSEDVVTLIMGDENHPEVKGIKSCAKGASFVIGSAEELEELVKEIQKVLDKSDKV
jgi:4-hydroxy-3-methylbut-2-enyl diphosphate reductase